MRRFFPSFHAAAIAPLCLLLLLSRRAGEGIRLHASSPSPPPSGAPTAEKRSRAEPEPAGPQLSESERKAPLAPRTPRGPAQKILRHGCRGSRWREHVRCAEASHDSPMQGHGDSSKRTRPTQAHHLASRRISRRNSARRRTPVCTSSRDWPGSTLRLDTNPLRRPRTWPCRSTARSYRGSRGGTRPITGEVSRHEEASQALGESEVEIKEGERRP